MLQWTGWSTELIPQLKEMHQELQIDVMEAEANGHDHLPGRHESSMDGEGGGAGYAYYHETKIFRAPAFLRSVLPSFLPCFVWRLFVS